MPYQQVKGNLIQHTYHVCINIKVDEEYNKESRREARKLKRRSFAIMSLFLLISYVILELTQFS